MLNLVCIYGYVVARLQYLLYQIKIKILSVIIISNFIKLIIKCEQKGN